MWVIERLSGGLQPCNGWAQYEYEEEVGDGFLIRRSPEFTYYNRIERLSAWKGNRGVTPGLFNADMCGSHGASG